MAVLISLGSEAPDHTRVVLEPPESEEPVLWLLQRSTDVIINRHDDDGAGRFDSPNGAWGLELVPALPGHPIVLEHAALADPSAYQLHWLDLETGDAEVVAAVRTYLRAQSAYQSREYCRP